MAAAQTQRYDVGVGVLKQVGGHDYDVPLRALEDIAPDLAYGDIMSRPTLDLKTRQIITVAALAAMGNAHRQLKYHINGAINVGWMPSQIVEAIFLSAVYAGFPAALNGVFAAKEVFEQRGVMPITTENGAANEERYARGLRTLEQVSGGVGANVVKSLEQIAPDLGRLIIEFSYGDIVCRSGLDYRTKELSTVALLTAVGTGYPSSRFTSPLRSMSAKHAKKSSKRFSRWPFTPVSPPL